MQKEMQSPEIYPHVYSQLIFWQRLNNSVEKDSLFLSGARTSSYPNAKKKKKSWTSIYTSLYKKLNQSRSQT